MADHIVNLNEGDTISIRTFSRSGCPQTGQKKSYVLGVTPSGSVITKLTNSFSNGIWYSHGYHR